jgi:hypothetical protein
MDRPCRGVAIARYRQRVLASPSRALVEKFKSMQSLTERTIALLRKASDFAAAAHDSDLTEVEIDGYRLNAIALELELRTLAGKLEFASRSGSAKHGVRA